MLSNRTLPLAMLLWGGFLVAGAAFVGTAGASEPPAAVAVVMARAEATPTATATATARPRPTATPTPSDWPFNVPWEVDCEDDQLENGYENQGYCVPGLVSWDAARFNNPAYFAGAISSYGQGIAEDICAYRQTYLKVTCSKYVGYLAVMGCGDIGKRAYIQRPGYDWEGPFLVVDCSGRKDIAVNIIQKRLAGEVDYGTAQRWGQATVGWANVRIQGNSGGGAGVPLREWYINEALSFAVPARLHLTEPTPCPPGYVPAHALSAAGEQYLAGCMVPPTDVGD